MVLVDLCLVPLVLIIVGFVILVGKGVVMVLLLDRGKVPLCLFLNELVRLFGYPSGSAGALLAGTLPLRYCTTRFASRIPTWRLPVPGHAASLVTAGIEVPSALGIEVSCRRVHCVGGSGLVRQRIRLNRKTLHTSLVLGFNVVHDCGRGCVLCKFRFPLFLILRGGVAIRIMRIWFLLRSGLELDDFLHSLQAHTSRSACR